MKNLLLLLTVTLCVFVTSCDLFNSNIIGHPVDNRPVAPPSGADIGYYDQRDPQYIGYTIDKRYVYYRGVVMNGADPRYFQDLGDGYGKDNKYVYFNGRRMQGINPSTFTGRSSDRRAGQQQMPPTTGTQPRTRW